MKYIYEIENLINGKTYYGKRTAPKNKTFDQDYEYMGSGVLLWGYKRKDGTIVNGAYKKYGIENFVKSCIVFGDFSTEQINKFEKCIIRIMRLNGKAEYNIHEGGWGWMPYYGKQSEETKKKHSIISKEKWKDPEFRKKTISGMIGRAPTKGNTGNKGYKLDNSFCLGEKNSQYGTHWYTNGVENIIAKECPEGYKLGRSNTGFHWYNNGTNSILSKECPEGYKKGRIV